MGARSRPFDWEPFYEAMRIRENAAMHLVESFDQGGFDLFKQAVKDIAIANGLPEPVRYDRSEINAVLFKVGLDWTVLNADRRVA
ncbi:MAG: hypothetical protein JWM58_674 [Rhizobium sp.]|nr:hypothetical protein [Rhizobium sp.]